METQSVELRVLSAACDMAVIRALELVGKRVARDGRSRYSTMLQSNMMWHEAHTMWPAEEAHVNAALSGAWSVLPRVVEDHGCCSLQSTRLALVLDTYVRDLVADRRSHTFRELERRLLDAAVT